MAANAVLAPNENITREEYNELIKVLEAQGLDFKTLAKQAAEAKTREAKAREAVDSIPHWKLIMANYPDFVIEKTKGTLVKRLVIMPSSSGYYIQTMKDGVIKDSIILDSKGWTTFFATMPQDIALPEGFWTQTIQKEKAFFDYLWEYLHMKDNNTTMEDMLKHRCAPEMRTPASSWDHANTHQCAQALKAYAANPSIYAKARQWRKFGRLIDRAPGVLTEMVARWGANNVFDFAAEFENSLMMVPSSLNSLYRRRGVDWRTQVQEHYFPQETMEYAAFKQFMLYDSVRAGFADNMGSFLRTWDDTLDMQNILYNKVREKYPEHLVSYHDSLAYQTRMHSQKIGLGKFKKHVELILKYEDKIMVMQEDGANTEYLFIAPKTPEDFYDEATQQANCLAGYVSKFANGECGIMFMRNAKTPDKSLVTIEVRNGKITQAYAARNTYPAPELRAVIKTWADKNKWEYDPRI